MKHGVEAYDVLQIQQPTGWVDYSTIKDESDYRYAIRLCDGESFGGHPAASFRITSGGSDLAKYPKYTFTTDKGVTHVLGAREDWNAILETFSAFPDVPCGHVRFGPHSLAATSYHNRNRMIELA